MNNADYWKDRFGQLEAAQNQKGADTYEEIEKIYRQAQREIEGKINTWYHRFAANNGISMTEARRRLFGADLKEFKWDVNDYIRYGKKNAISQGWMKELENASARFHITRLEALKLHIQQSMEQTFGNQLDCVDAAMRRIYQDGYYHTAYEFQKGFGIGWDIAGLDQKHLEKVIAKPWAVDGKNFSERIWSNKQKLISEIHNELTRNVILGRDPQKAIDAIARKMKTSKYNAGRLVMTEEAYFSSLAQRDCFQALDVEQYEIVAVLDSRTSEICQEMDGKVFLTKDFKAGVTAPPFHVFCRSTTVPYYGEDFRKIGQRAARGKDGKTYYVLGDVTYEKWKKVFVDGGNKSGLQEITSDDIMKKKPEVKELNKLKQSGMTEIEYQEYLNIISSHSNEDVVKLYSKYADKIEKVNLTTKGGVYQPASGTLNFTYPKYDDMNKYGTLAHEYGHFFDDKVKFDGVHFNEIDTLNGKVKIGSGAVQVFKRVPSSSDEFLEALRKDKEELRKTFQSARNDILSSNATSGIQDALEGFFGKKNVNLKWGHGDDYYNRKFNKFIKSFGKEKEFGEALEELGIDASNSSKRKNTCRIYETASEAWANIMSAETCRGEELEAVKKYLPNTYAALLKIIGKVR